MVLQLDLVNSKIFASQNIQKDVKHHLANLSTSEQTGHAPTPLKLFISCP